MKNYFKEVAAIIEQQDFSKLNDLKIPKPEYFNWVTEIFEGIHLKNHPDKAALLWTDGKITKEYSFKNLTEKTNRLINFLRKKGIQQHDIILTQLMLQPVNWYATLATIKGGFQMIPTATIMGSQDLAFRFSKTVLRLFIQEDLNSFDFSFRQCVAAGEPLNPEIIEEWRNTTGITIRDGFGQTESTCLVANLPDTPIKLGSMGKPTFLYDVVIADEEGTICVRMDRADANGIFKGYLLDKDKEAQVFKNGLYYTGDKASKDSEGYIWFIGRDDDVIKASDYRIGPFEVESILLEHERVIESAVVGSPHAIKGYEVKAFIILNSDTTPSEQLAIELFKYSREHLAPYKVPRIIEFVEELPKTISGKIRRVELRAQEAENKAKKIFKPFEYFYSK